MTAAKKGLGRGFDSLIPVDLIDESFNPNATFDLTVEQDQKLSQGAKLALARLRVNPNQPRRTFDEEALTELADSIKEHGVIQPIIVVPRGDMYEIVAGERRYRAAKIANLTEVPVIVRTLSAQNQLEISLIENIQRRDLNAVETATAYAKLRDQFNLSNDQIAARVHKSASTVSNAVRLLKLPAAALEAVAKGLLTEGQVRPLIGQDGAIIDALLPKIIAEAWSARKIEQYVVAGRLSEQKGKALGQQNGSNLSTDQKLQHQRTIQVLTNHLKTPVDIRVNSHGAGKITIKFKTPAELDRIEKLFE